MLSSYKLVLELEKLLRAHADFDIRICMQPVAPGHSFILGHLLYLKDRIDNIPNKAHYFYAFGDIYLSHFQDEGVFYLDMWPVAGLMLVVISPPAATEAFQSNHLTSMRKPDMLANYFKPIAGGPNLFDMEEEDVSILSSINCSMLFWLAALLANISMPSGTNS